MDKFGGKKLQLPIMLLINISAVFWVVCHPQELDT